MQLLRAFKESLSEFFGDKALRLSAALAYYSVFSLAPLLLIALSIAGLFYDDKAATGVLDDQLRSIMGKNAAAAVQEMVMHSRKPTENVFASVAGIAVLIIGAGGVFGQLQEALNTVWGIESRPGRGIKGMIKDRFLSFSMVLGTGFLLLTSLILTTLLQAANDTISNLLPIAPIIWQTIGSVGSFLLVAALFAAIFKVLPDVEIQWRDVWIGALVTAGLFTIGKFALSWYLGREATSSSYGSAGSLVLILLWVYYSAIILLFGAEFTQVHARLLGRDLQPSKGARRIGG
jgi:membrane protein